MMMKHYLKLAFMFAVFAIPLKAETIEETQDNPSELATAERKQKALSVISTVQKKNVEVDASDLEDHVEVGTRQISHAEWIQGQEEKERIATLRAPVDSEEQSEATALNEEDAFEEVSESELIAKATYQTWHQGALHRPIAVTSLGDVVTLEDGSEWIVKYSNRYKTLDWLASDSIIILPNHAWFSSYYYRLVNQNTGADIEVNLFKGPIYNGVHSHWIVAIDYYNNEVCLEDGSIWKVAPGEWSTFKKWVVNDTVIIGINDSWFSSKPNTLINVNMLNWVAAGPTHHDYVLHSIVTP